MKRSSDIRLDYAELLAKQILENYITVAALEAFAEKEGCTVAEALDGRLYDRLLDMVRARTGADSWPEFAELPDSLPKEVRESEEISDAAFDIGVNGWEIGYLAGFADRNGLC